MNDPESFPLSCSPRRTWPVENQGNMATWLSTDDWLQIMDKSRSKGGRIPGHPKLQPVAPRGDQEARPGRAKTAVNCGEVGV